MAGVTGGLADISGERGHRRLAALSFHLLETSTLCVSRFKKKRSPSLKRVQEVTTDHFGEKKEQPPETKVLLTFHKSPDPSDL